jgi:hypothetical protein
MIRTVLAVIVGLVTYWLVGLLLSMFHPPGWVSFLVSVAVAIGAGMFAWTRLEAAAGMVKSVLIGALVGGAIGFCVGFFGPMMWAPQANQGPLLGIFITGPIGFLLGGIGGGLWWRMRRKRAAEPA